MERGSFRPVTVATNDMLDGARRVCFIDQCKCGEQDWPSAEMTLENLLAEGQLNHADFLARSISSALLAEPFSFLSSASITNWRVTSRATPIAWSDWSWEFPACSRFSTRITITISGCESALGRMFKGGLKLYVYPMIDEKTGKIVTAGHARVAPNLTSLFQNLTGQSVQLKRSPIIVRTTSGEFILPDKLTRSCNRATPAGSEWFHPEVVTMIKERGFFGYSGRSKAAQSCLPRAGPGRKARLSARFPLLGPLKHHGPPRRFCCWY